MAFGPVSLNAKLDLKLLNEEKREEHFTFKVAIFNNISYY